MLLTCVLAISAGIVDLRLTHVAWVHGDLEGLALRGTFRLGHEHEATAPCTLYIPGVGVTKRLKTNNAFYDLFGKHHKLCFKLF